MQAKKVENVRGDGWFILFALISQDTQVCAKAHRCEAASPSQVRLLHTATHTTRTLHNFVLYFVH